MTRDEADKKFEEAVKECRRVSDTTTLHHKEMQEFLDEQRKKTVSAEDSQTIQAVVAEVLDEEDETDTGKFRMSGLDRDSLALGEI